MTDQPTRTPYCHKIRYGITGAPILTQDDMGGSHLPGAGLAPTLIELVYSAPMDGKPASVSASVTGDWTRYGKRDESDQHVTTHFKNGPHGWPAWLAEEARLHDPDTPPADPAAIRDRIAEAARTVPLRLGPNAVAMAQRGEPIILNMNEADDLASAVLPLLSAPVDRAAVYREAADELATAFGDPMAKHIGALGAAFLRRRARDIEAGRTTEARRMAVEAQPTQPQPETCVHCGREIENRGDPSMDGNHEIRWVHVPGGYNVCFPQQGGHSPGAEPRSAALDEALPQQDETRRAGEGR